MITIIFYHKYKQCQSNKVNVRKKDHAISASVTTCLSLCYSQYDLVLYAKSPLQGKV